MKHLFFLAIATENFPWAFTAVYILGGAAAVIIGLSAVKRAREVNIEQMQKEEEAEEAQKK
jgi:threonine/homoserine/homoserine lactone efflux protein